MPRRKTFRKLIEKNYDNFKLKVHAFNDMILMNCSKHYYDRLGRLTRLGVLYDSNNNYILCIRKHECPLFIDDTVKSYGTGCCNAGWYYYISKEEYLKLQSFCLYNVPNVSKLVSDIQARASVCKANENDGKQVYAIAVCEINNEEPNKLIGFFKPQIYTQKSTKEYIKNGFFRIVGYDYV